MKREKIKLDYKIAFLLAYFGLFLVVFFLSPSYSFYTGDQGLKFIQILNMVEHGPLYFALPEKSVPTAVLHHVLPDIMTIERNGLTYPIFSHLFAAISAPLYLLAGYFGLFLLPFLSVCGCCLLACRMASRLFNRDPTGRWGLLLILASPVAFYGMVLWEHAPALFFCSLALYSFLFPSSGRATFLGGVALGIASCFRLESLLFGLAMALAYFVPRLRSRSEDGGAMLLKILLYGGGVLLGFMPQLLVNYHTLGSILGSQVMYNLDQLATAGTSDSTPAAAGVLNPSWWGTVWIQWVRPWRDCCNRLFFGELWIPVSASLILALAGCFILKKARKTTCEYYAAVLMVLFLTGVSAFPVLRYLTTRAPVPYWNFWFTFPASVLTLYVPFLFKKKNEQVSFLMWCAVLTVILRLVAMPIGGGVHWGGRFMLPALVPLALIAVWVMVNTETMIYRRAIVIVLLASLLTQGIGAAKIVSARKQLEHIPSNLARLTQPGEVILSPYIYLYQICPTLARDRTFLRINANQNIRMILDNLPVQTPVSLVGPRTWRPMLDESPYRLSTEEVDLEWGGLILRRVDEIQGVLKQ